MKHTTRKMMTVALLVATFLACKKDKDTPSLAGTFYGPAQTLGSGQVKSVVTLNAAGQPVKIGAVISETAMNSLPDGDDEVEFELELPAQALAKTPFKYIGLGYNPHGHEPEGVYTVQHFDFHFYKITNAERLTITPGDPKLDSLPAPAYLPATFFPAGGVPFMGNHWIDPAAPELNGQPFTTTFLYGSYDGKVTFVEPMITVDFLKATDNLKSVIKQAQKFAPAGIYPTNYVIKYNHVDKQYEVTLEDFVAHNAD